MNLYISTSAGSPKTSLVASVLNPVPIKPPRLVVGDTIAVNIYLVTSTGAYDSASGAAGSTVTAAIGEAGETPLWASADFDQITNGWAGYISTNTQAIKDLFEDGTDPVELLLEIRVVNSLGYAQTYASVPVSIYNHAIDDGVTTTGTLSPTTTNVFAYDGDPNGVLAATGPALCFGTGSTQGDVWQKTTTGTSSSEWVKIISVS